MLGLLSLDRGYFRGFFAALAGERIKPLEICAERIYFLHACAGEIAVVMQITGNFIRVLLVEQETQILFFTYLHPEYCR